MVIEHTETLIRLEGSLPEAVRPGCRVVVIDLDVYDRSWNPARADQLLRGPAQVTYVFWEDGEVEARVRPIIAIPV